MISKVNYKVLNMCELSTDTVFLAGCAFCIPYAERHIGRFILNMDTFYVMNWNQFDQFKTNEIIHV